ncbi:MAG TPA: hypothetical protein VFU54_18950 [Actinomycetota bacterium]|nr:hypothetical protein [Actinomycetota bacterium]
MNGRGRGWVRRLAPARLASEPGGTRPGLPGPGNPGPAGGDAEPEGAALRVLLVSRDAMLAEALEALVEPPGEVSLLDWRADSLELALHHADVVVIDVPPVLHEGTFALIDGRFLGRTVVLLQEGEPEEDLPPGPSRVVLYRPLQIGDLWAAVTAAVQPLPPPSPPEPSRPAAREEEAAAGAGTGAEAARPPGQEPMIGMSGRELEPVIGPGQVAPGMDADTLERLRRWHTRAASAPTAEPEAAPPAERTGPSGKTGRAARARAALGTMAAGGQVAGRAARASVARAGAASARRARAVRAVPGWLAGLARPAVVVVLAGIVGLGAAGWRGEGGPDLLAGEVASAQAARSVARTPDLLLPDPRVGPVGPVHALAVGAWLRLTGPDTENTLEAAVRAARTPSHVLLAGVVMLTVILSLLLMRAGPGSGAAAGPGPAPPHQSPPAGTGRLGGAAAVGLLVAVDPLLVRSGRVAAGTALALLLALATLALAWAPPRRPARLALIGAGAGLALLASPLALPMLAVPLVAALLERQPRAAGHALAALGIGAALWTALPLWVAGQELDPELTGWLLGRPPGRGSLGASLAAFPLSWLLAAAGLAAAIWVWRRPNLAWRSVRPDGAGVTGPGQPRSRPDGEGRSRDARLLAWVATTTAGSLVAFLLGWPVEQALPFALPAAASAVGLTLARAWQARDLAEPGRSSASLAGRRMELVTGRVGLALAVAVGCLVLAQGVDWARRYGGRPDDALGRLVGVVDARLADCSAVNAGGPDDRARLLAAGVDVTDFSSGPAARAAGVRYFVLTGGAAAWRGGQTPPALAQWVRQHGSRLADLHSPSFSRVQLWQVDTAALDPTADSVPVAGGAFSNVDGSACGGYRVLDNDLGTFYTAYLALGGKAVLGRPLSSVWTSDGPALQAFDTMVLGAVPNATGRRPSVRPVDLPLLLAKLDPRAVAAAGVPPPSARPPVTTTEAQVLMTQPAITRLYLGVDAAAATPSEWRRAGERLGRPLGVPRVMPDGAVRQPFERTVIELTEGGAPARLVPLGQLAVRVGLVPEQARRLEPVPGLAARTDPTAVEPDPLLRLLAGGLGLLALAGAAGVAAGRARAGRRVTPPPGD